MVVMIVVMVMIVVRMVVVMMIVAAVRAVHMVWIVMIVVMIVPVQEFRVVHQDALQVERAAVQHLVERNGGAVGVMDGGMRIDGAHGGFDKAQLVRRHKVGLVDEHHVGEGDLVLGLARILQAQRQVFGVHQARQPRRAGSWPSHHRP